MSEQTGERSKELRLEVIDASIETRYRLDESVVKEYGEKMRAGVQFPPLKLVEERKAECYWMWDGQHRLKAAKLAKLKTLSCRVKQGTKQEALRLALGANADHGLRRTNADKRKCVLIAMNEPEFEKMSNRKLAELCSVSRMLVKEIKDEIADKAAESDDDLTSNSKTKDRVRKTKKKQTQAQVDQDGLRGALAVIRGFPYSGLDANEKWALTDGDVFDIRYARDWLKELLG